MTDRLIWADFPIAAVVFCVFLHLIYITPMIEPVASYGELNPKRFKLSPAHPYTIIPRQ